MDHPGLPQLIIILVYLGLLLALGLFSSRLFKGTKGRLPSREPFDRSVFTVDEYLRNNDDSFCTGR